MLVLLIKWCGENFDTTRENILIKFTIEHIIPASDPAVVG